MTERPLISEVFLVAELLLLYSSYATETTYRAKNYCICKQIRNLYSQLKGDKENLVAFAQQKRVAIKEKILFYRDGQKQELLFTLRAEKALDVHGRYLVEDPEGRLLGSFKKQFKQSLISSTWNILRDDQPSVTVTESNQALAVLRRFGGFVPLIGELIDIVTVFLRYHFTFIDTRTGQKIGAYQKKTLIRDHYLLQMNDDAYDAQDWRVWAAFSVALDALQSR